MVSLSLSDDAGRVLNASAVLCEFAAFLAFTRQPRHRSLSAARKLCLSVYLFSHCNAHHLLIITCIRLRVLLQTWLHRIIFIPKIYYRLLFARPRNNAYGCRCLCASCVGRAMSFSVPSHCYWCAKVFRMKMWTYVSGVVFGGGAPFYVLSYTF